MDTNLSLYRIFYTVAQCGSISAAARHLYISQPAISKSISNLENERTSDPPLRTYLPRCFSDRRRAVAFSSCPDAFHSLEAGEAELSCIRDMGLGHLTIGVSTTLCGTVCCLYLKTFIAQYPHIQYQYFLPVHQSYTGYAQRRLY